MSRANNQQTRTIHHNSYHRCPHSGIAGCSIGSCFGKGGCPVCHTLLHTYPRICRWHQHGQRTPTDNHVPLKPLSLPATPSSRNVQALAYGRHWPPWSLPIPGSDGSFSAGTGQAQEADVASQQPSSQTALRCACIAPQSLPGTCRWRLAVPAGETSTPG